MIILLMLLGCGESPNSALAKTNTKERKEYRKKLKNEKYKEISADLEQTKTDMKCIKEFITVQQQVPEEKLEYEIFEKERCEENKIK